MHWSRRKFLASVATGGGAVLGGCQETRSPTREGPTSTPTTGRTPTEPGGTPPTATESGTPAFDAVVDMVADEGVDDGGETPIDDALQANARDGTLLEFPPGTYLVTEPLLLQEATNFGIRGTGADRGAVRFVHPTGHTELFLNVRDGAGCLLENFTVDQTDDRVTSTGIIFLQRDGLAVRDVEVSGFTPSEGENPDQRGHINLIPSVLSPDGVGTVTRFVSTGGGEAGVYPDSYPGLYSGYHNQGTLRLVDCQVENCGGAGVYTSRTRGRVQVEGGLFRNNSVAQVRVAGEGSYIRGARIVVDTDRRRTDRGSVGTIRGVWWESGEYGRTGGVIEDCEFVARSAAVQRGLLEVDGTAGAMTVRDSTFRTDLDRYYAINAFRPGSSPMGGAPDGPWGITLENVRVTGSAAGAAAIRIDSRPDSTLDDVSVEQPGVDRDGVVVVGSPRSRIVGGVVDVDRFPLRMPLDDSAETESCRLVVGDGVTVASRVSLDALSEFRVGLPTASASTCLPPTDAAGDAFVLVGRCSEGLVGGVVDASFDPQRTDADLDCG